MNFLGCRQSTTYFIFQFAEANRSENAWNQRMFRASEQNYTIHIALNQVLTYLEKFKGRFVCFEKKIESYLNVSL